MAIIYTFPQKASVEANDTFVMTDSSDNQTKTVTASAIAAYIDDEVDLQEVLAKGNTATNNINLTGNYNGTGNITASGTFSLGGNATLTGAGSQFITKTTGELNIVASAGVLGLRASGSTNELKLQSDQDIEIDAPSGTVEIDSTACQISSPTTSLLGTDLLLGSSSATSKVRITGGNGGSGYYPNSITDEFSFAGAVKFLQVVKDSNGSIGGAGQALLAVSGGKVEWTTLNSQTLAQNQILVGNASNVPTASGLITANITTDDITVGVASSKVSVFGSLAIPANGGAKGPTDAGSPGELAFDSSYLYICTGTNSWRRITLLLIP
jgi:hypothetical protein